MLCQLQEELKIFVKNGDRAAATSIRNIIGKLKAAEIDKGSKLNDGESVKILITATKQLRDSIQHYKTGGRKDLEMKESYELSLIEKYLPEQLSEEKIEKIIKDKIKSCNAESIQDMGKVMSLVMKDISGFADGKIVQNIEKRELL